MSTALILVVDRESYSPVAGPQASLDAPRRWPIQDGQQRLGTLLRILEEIRRIRRQLQRMCEQRQASMVASSEPEGTRGDSNAAVSHLSNILVMRKQLGRRLARIRMAGDLARSRVAGHMRWSHSKLIRIEFGDACISHADLVALLRFYGVEDEKRVLEMTQIAEIARQPRPFRIVEALSSEFRAYLEAEREAHTLQSLSIRSVCQDDGQLRPDSAIAVHGGRAATGAAVDEPAGVVDVVYGAGSFPPAVVWRSARLAGAAAPNRLIDLAQGMSGGPPVPDRGTRRLRSYRLVSGSGPTVPQWPANAEAPEAAAANDSAMAACLGDGLLKAGRAGEASPPRARGSGNVPNRVRRRRTAPLRDNGPQGPPAHAGPGRRCRHPTSLNPLHVKVSLDGG